MYSIFTVTEQTSIFSLFIKITEAGRIVSPISAATTIVTITSEGKETLKAIKWKTRQQSRCTIFKSVTIFLVTEILAYSHQLQERRRM